MSIKVQADPRNVFVMMNIQNSGRNARRGIRQGFYSFGHELRNGVRRRIKSGPKTGKLYRVKGRRRRVRASAPGEDPANRSGKLRRSVGFQVYGSDRLEFGYRNSVDYGIFLELGTQNMEARPALKKQVDESQATARQHFDRELQKALKNK